jgi:hypothetical protein
VEFGDVSDWQPIETAPKDGTLVLVYVAGSQNPYAFGQWDTEYRLWRQVEHARDFIIDAEPTLWMPIPEPPDA